MKNWICSSQKYITSEIWLAGQSLTPMLESVFPISWRRLGPYIIELMFKADPTLVYVQLHYVIIHGSLSRAR